MTAERKRAPKKMSLDRGFVQTKRQREIEKAFFKGGGRHPFYMSHIAADLRRTINAIDKLVSA
jgi:hypothetical protein